MAQMSLWCLLVAVFGCYGLGYCAVYHSTLPEKPKQFAYLSGCYVKEINNVVPVGAVVTPRGFCYEIECSRFYLHYASCSKVYTDDPRCYITDEDTSQTYPSCCPTIKCDTNYID